MKGKETVKDKRNQSKGEFAFILVLYSLTFSKICSN